MQLEGSCHCGAVRFTAKSPHPYPFNLCYCSICRKTAGAGGFAINISADHTTLEVEGEANVRTYRAKMKSPGGRSFTESVAERKFCGNCGSPLWVWDPRWPELMHPHASAIDTELPVPPERTHLMLANKPRWVEPCVGENDKTFDEYPEESIAAWHDRLGLSE
jgi:hypothetical protein